MSSEKDVLLDAKAPDALVYRQLHADAQRFVDLKKLVPPLTLDELHLLAGELIGQKPELAEWKNRLIVMLNNAVWRGVVASVPFNRRILLLPKCLRNFSECKAPVDEYGLLCMGCGGCELDAVQNEAEKLGLMCLIAEGSAVVADLLESGSVDAVIGVSCLDALEKSFPFMVRHAIPGLAFPLFNDGCKDTQTDMALVREAFAGSNGEKFIHLDIRKLLKGVQGWYNERELAPVLGPCRSKIDVIARNWINLAGHRFRPFLVAAVATCMGVEDCHGDIELRKLAMAVECFHKASLIHDDIEDNDAVRYGQPALHKQWGVATALNIGDFLLGEGYRLISELKVSDGKRARLLNIAATHHLTLCRGQGEELLAKDKGCVGSVGEVMEIFRNKTAPAFEVAIMFGLIYADGDEKFYSVVSDFSSKLGVAFQIHDDLVDEAGDNESGELSIIKAIAMEKSVSLAQARHEAWRLYNDCRTRTLKTLADMEDYGLKRLFFQITMRILPDAPEPSDSFA